MPCVKDAFAALLGQSFTVNGAKPIRSAALFDLGVEASFDSGLSATVNFYGASAKLVTCW